MASLVLLLSELLKHQDPDLLMSFPAAGGAASASKRDADMIRKAAAAARCHGEYGTKCNAELQLQDDFPKVSVEMVWP